MSGEFRTYDEQIAKLLEKGLAVSDVAAAKSKLAAVGYFALVSGYKEPLRDPSTRRYKPGVSFDDVVALYDFDDALRDLFERSINDVELKLKSTLSYAFCERHGEGQAAYLDPANYTPKRKKAKAVSKLLTTLGGLANVNTDYAYIVHHRKKRGNVPLWVIMRALTFGQASMMYSFLLPADKATVAKGFDHVNERELAQMMLYLVLYRNVCAHGERLFSHRAYSDMPDTALHAKLGLARNGQEYACGKRDLFGCVIALRYLLSAEGFLAFKRRLASIIDRFLRGNEAVERGELFAYMGFPENWKDVTRYRM